MNINKITKFLSGVKNHNNKEYFDTVRSEWAEIKQEVIAFVTPLIELMKEFDPALSMLDPKTTLYRINRDIRFSKDKSPYKSWIAIGVTDGKKSDQKPTYYFHIDYQGRLEYGSGSWGVEPEVTKIFRNEIVKHPKTFLSVVESLSQDGLYFEEMFKKIKVPNGYPKEEEISEYLKYTSFAVGGKSMQIQSWSNKKLFSYLLTFYKKTYPLMVWARKTIKQNTTNA